MGVISQAPRRVGPAPRKVTGGLGTRPMPGGHTHQAVFRAILRSTGVQAKLAIGQPNDRYEREADRVADHVLHMSAADVAAPTDSGTARQMPVSGVRSRHGRPTTRQPHREVPTLQTKERPEHARPLGPAITPRLGLYGAGRPLSTSQRNYFEPRFGRDFGGVRLHDDTAATGAAAALQARAFTLGTDIVFNRGELRDDIGGRRLLAHELAHVVQQGRAVSAPRIQCQDGAGASCSARYPENCPTYEMWLYAFRNVPQFISNDGAPSARTHSRFRVLGSPDETPSRATSGSSQVGERFIDHPTDDWVRNNLPPNLRATAYQLPTDCADIFVILRHVYLSAHRRTEYYMGYWVGSRRGRAEQHMVRRLIATVGSGNARHIVNPYLDGTGCPQREYSHLRHLLHPGDQLVWAHHANGLDRPRSGGHTQTISNIHRHGDAITRIDVLQGNQPLGPPDVQGIVDQLNRERRSHGLRPLSRHEEARLHQRWGPIRSAPGRRIERSSLRGTALGDVTIPQAPRWYRCRPRQVWGWSDTSNTILVVAGSPRAAPRPEARWVHGHRHPQLTDWLRPLGRASLRTLHGVFSAALHEARADIDGGQTVPAQDAAALGRSAGQRLRHLTRHALGRLAGPLHHMRDMIRALGGIAALGGTGRAAYLGNPQSAADVQRTFTQIDTAFDQSARGVDFNQSGP